MRHKGASTLIYLIFGLLIVVFVITPLSGPGDIGCRGSGGGIVDVDGERVNENAYKIAYSSPFTPRNIQGRNKVYFALDMVIRRELLAQAAEERGLRTNDEMLNEEIKKGYFFVGGERITLDEWVFDIHDDGDRTWSLGKFLRFVQSLDVSRNAYLLEQERGLQAALMAELLASSAQVSRDEALTEFLYTNNTVTYDVVSFSPAIYRAAMLLTDADVERFLAAHEDQVKARHKERERDFLDRKPELKLRQIFIAKAIAKAEPEAKPEDQKPEDARPDDKLAGDAPKPAGVPIEEAKAKLDAARQAVASGKQKFAELARQLNTEPVLKANGGDVGWKTAENASLGEKVVSDAVKTLKPGEMTPVITTERGAYLVLAEASREKDLTYDQVKHELAAELAREVWSKEAAKRQALEALETARAGGKKLEDMYLREIKPGPDFREIQRMINDPNTDPTIRQLLQQQLQQQLQLQLGGGDDHGAIVIESPDVLAASKPCDGGSAGAPAGGGEAPAPGSAAPTPAAGGEAPAPAAGAPQAAPAPPLVASSDVLPAFGDVTPPKVRRESAQPRQKLLPGVDADGVKALFDELEKGQLASRVHEADGNYTVVQLIDKAEAKIEDFDKNASRHIDRLREVRGLQLVHDWVKARCEELTKDRKITPRSDKTAEFDDKGKPAPTVYQPCMTLQ